MRPLFKLDVEPLLLNARKGLGRKLGQRPKSLQEYGVQAMVAFVLSCVIHAAALPRDGSKTLS